MESTELSYLEIKSIFHALILSFLITSCNGQVRPPTETDNTNQSKTTSLLQPIPVDPLFFIDGQLCQHVRKIFQDRNGNLWFGTNVYGLMRYDGDTLEYFNKKNGHDFSRITGFAQDKNGNMWLSTYQGLIKYDGNSFTSFTQKDGLLNNEIWSFIIDSKGIFWIGTNEGVSRFNGKEFSAFSIPKAAVKDPNTIYSPDRIVSISEDKNGDIWFGTDGFGICKYDGEIFTHYTTEDGLSDNTIHELMADSKGNIWIGTYYGGVSVYNGKKFINFTQEGQIDGVEVSGFYEDQLGNIWFAAENNGVYSYDGKIFTNLNINDGLITNGILSIFEDKEGRFWFGGWGGLFRYDGTFFFPVTINGPWSKQ